jgi:hypothetical protein
MTSNKVIAVIFVFLLVLLCGCDNTTKTSTTTTTSVTISGYQETVDAMARLHMIEFPEYLREYNSVKKGGEFNVNEYFKVLTHLKIADGYTLDYIYNFQGSGGQPDLYVRPTGQPPYANYEEYAAAMLGDPKIFDVFGIITPLWNEESKAYEDKIIIDGTEDGFFEYVVLQIMGSQFYLFWHAAYNDWQIICDQARLEGIVDDIMSEDYGMPPPMGFENKAKRLDVRPVININDDVAVVSVVYFTDWGGFKRLTYTIKKEYPHTIINIETETLVEYDCGITF